ncbi:MAG: TOBE domain-containing protein [Rhodanobacteraceae bacterium]
MKTSARNELAGTIRSVTPGAVNSEVVLDLGGHDELVAIITNASADRLSLKPGVAAFALVKAPWVILGTSDGLRTSARNHFQGTIDAVHHGAVNDEVTLKLAGGARITAIVTTESVHELGLRPGLQASALIKASHVIIAVAA